MQIGVTEIIIILGLLLLLIVSERGAQLLVNQARGGQKARKEELPQAGSPDLPPHGDNNSLNAQTITGSIVIVGDGNNVTVKQGLDPGFDKEKLRQVFVSSPLNFPESRSLVYELMRGPLGTISTPRYLHLTPSVERSPTDLERDLPGSDLFLLFARLPLEPAQLEEKSRAQALRKASLFFFAPQSERDQIASDLQLLPEQVIGYTNLDDLKYQALACIVKEFLLNTTRYRWKRVDIALLIGLANQLAAGADWLEEIRAWLAQQPPAPDLPVEEAPAAADLPAVESPPETARPQQTAREPARPTTGLLPFEPETVPVPAGDFWMGSAENDEQAWEGEKPRHLVYLDAYRIGKYPLTVAQFRVFVERTGHRTTAEQDGSKYTWRAPRGAGSDLRGKEHHPVTQVSWEDASAYCGWLSRATGREYSLPTEAQWEKAARGGLELPAEAVVRALEGLEEGENTFNLVPNGSPGRTYPWGNTAPDRDHCNIMDWFGGTTPVGQFSPLGDSPYRCADMAGNVWEWCADWYGEKYYAISPRRNPTGPPEGVYHVLRGGSWSIIERYARCSARCGIRPVLLQLAQRFSGCRPPFFPLNSAALVL